MKERCFQEDVAWWACVTEMEDGEDGRKEVRVEEEEEEEVMEEMNTQRGMEEGKQVHGSRETSEEEKWTEREGERRDGDSEETENREKKEARIEVFPHADYYQTNFFSWLSCKWKPSRCLGYVGRKSTVFIYDMQISILLPSFG